MGDSAAQGVCAGNSGNGKGNERLRDSGPNSRAADERSVMISWAANSCPETDHVTVRSMAKPESATFSDCGSDRAKRVARELLTTV